MVRAAACNNINLLTLPSHARPYLPRHHLVRTTDTKCEGLTLEETLKTTGEREVEEGQQQSELRMFCPLLVCLATL